MFISMIKKGGIINYASRRKNSKIYAFILTANLLNELSIQNVSRFRPLLQLVGLKMESKGVDSKGITCSSCT